MASMGESKQAKYSALTKALPKPTSVTGVILRGQFILAPKFRDYYSLAVNKNQASKQGARTH
jgi:hypothetical protein